MAEPYETPPSMQDIYDKDKERYKESDRLIEEGDLKGAADVHPDREELRNNLTRQILGTGYEIGAGLTFDAITAPFAWTGPVYAAANFGEGALSNIIGQLIRGEKFNWSEVASSGALGMVPLSQLRLGKKATNIVGDVNTYRRTIASGAVTGVVDQTIQAGLGEQRLPTTGEVVGGALTGGIVGGGIKGTAVLGSKLRDQIGGTYEGLTYGLAGTSPRDTSGSNFRRFKVSDLMSSNAILRYINQKGDPKPIQNILTKMDNWRMSQGSNTRPMTGFSKHFIEETGQTPTFIVDDVEYGIGWSRKKNKYEIFNVASRIQSRRKRLENDLTSNVREKEKRKIIEAIRRDINLKSKTLKPDQWDLLIQNPGSAYVEHLIAVDSPFWKSNRGINAGYKAGDVRNLKIIGDENFKNLKDFVERYVHKNYPELYVDYDPLTQNLILKNLETGKALSNQIPGYGKFRMARAYVEDVLAGAKMKPIEDVYGPTDSPPPNIARQIDSAYFNNLTEFEKNIIVERIKGSTWSKIKQRFGNKLSTEQLTLLKTGYKQLTQKEVIAIVNAYKLGGKGRTPR